MKILSAVFLSSFALFAPRVGFAEKLSDVTECYDGLKLSLGVKRIHFGKGGTIFASGTRNDARGFYAFEGGKVFFHTLPTANTVEEMAVSGKSLERYDSGKKLNYYLTVESGGEKSQIIFVRSADRELSLRGEGNSRNFIDSPNGIEIPGPGGRRDTIYSPVHIAPKSSAELKADDADALKALTKSVGDMLNQAPRKLFNRVGLNDAIDRCLKSFPKGTSIGDALQPGTTQIVAVPGGGRYETVRGTVSVH